MLEIRRKYKSFTVIHYKDRYTARRKEDSFHIQTKEDDISLNFSMDDRIQISGTQTGYARIITPRDSVHSSTLILEVVFDEHHYLLMYPQNETPFVTDEKGTIFYFQKDGRYQEMRKDMKPLDVTVLFAVCLLTQDFLEWEYF